MEDTNSRLDRQYKFTEEVIGQIKDPDKNGHLDSEIVDYLTEYDSILQTQPDRRNPRRVQELENILEISFGQSGKERIMKFWNTHKDLALKASDQ